MLTDTSYLHYILQFLKEFLALCRTPYIKSAYKSGVSTVTTSQPLMIQVSEDGSYWQVLENVTQKEVIFQTCHCLSEVFLDFTIKEVVFNPIGVKRDPNAWADAVYAYAFGAQ